MLNPLPMAGRTEKAEACISHTRWKCQYHIVFIPKYRRKVIYGKMKEDIRDIIRTLC